MREKSKIEEGSLIPQRDKLLEAINKLKSKEDQWKFFRWEWLQRNKYYKGFAVDEGIYPTYKGMKKKLEAKKTEVEKSLDSLHLYFSQFCGLEIPVDPETGNWADCLWLPANTDLWVDGLSVYSELVGELCLDEAIQKDLEKISSQGIKTTSFPDPVKAIDTIQNNEVDLEVRLNRSIPSRVRVDQFCNGLVVYDYRKNHSLAEVAVGLGVIVSEDKTLTGTAKPGLDTLNKQYIDTKKRIDQSILLNPFEIGQLPDSRFHSED